MIRDFIKKTGISVDKVKRLLIDEPYLISERLEQSRKRPIISVKRSVGFTETGFRSRNISRESTLIERFNVELEYQQDQFYNGLIDHIASLSQDDRHIIYNEIVKEESKEVK